MTRIKKMLEFCDNVKCPTCNNRNFKISYLSTKYRTLKKSSRTNSAKINIECINKDCGAYFAIEKNGIFYYRFHVNYNNNRYTFSFNYKSIITIKSYNQENTFFSLEDKTINEDNFPGKEYAMKIIQNLIFQ